jgi:hypothetical protein
VAPQSGVKYFLRPLRLRILLVMSVMRCPGECGNLATFRQNPAYRFRPSAPEYLYDCPHCGRSLPLEGEQDLHSTREPAFA